MPQMAAESVRKAMSWKMTAVGDPRDPALLKQVTRAVPLPGPKQVLVRVAAAALNPIDYHTCQGMPIFGSPPMYVGFDFAGVVEEAGAESGFERGQAVFGDVSNAGDSTQVGGSLSEYMLVPHDLVALKPAGMSAADASSLCLVGVTVLDCLTQAHTPPGGRVLILGASGGVGTAAVQICKARGLYVIGVCSGKNRDMVLGLGADEVIDYREYDWSEKLSTEKVDTVFDFAPSGYSSEGSAGKARKVMRLQGAFVTVSGLEEEDSDDAEFRYSMVVRQPSAEKLQVLAQLVGQGKLRPVVERVYSFADAIVAFEHLMSGRAVGKLVVSVA
jgi:NADPH:quinone reductase-like Zn-dependent oxidoreductase